MNWRSFGFRRLRNLRTGLAAVLAVTVLCSMLWAMPSDSSESSAGVSSAVHSRIQMDNKGLGSDPWVQFLLSSLNMYSISCDLSDQGAMVPLYTDHHAGGTYGTPDAITNVTVNDNNPDAACGTSSYQMTWNGSGPNGYFQFDIGCSVPNRPRDNFSYGLAHTVRFYAKGDVTNRQLEVLVFQRSSCTPIQVAAQWFSLTTNWVDYALDISSLGLRPQDLHAVQFLMNPANDPGGGTVLLDEVRIDTDNYDPLRGVQSYIAHWSDGSGPPNSSSWRDYNLYPNHSYLYDNALAIEGLLIGGYTTPASDIANGRLAGVNCANGLYRELNSGHTLQGDGTPRAPFTLLQRLGDNSWFGLALLDLFYANGNTQYRDCARQISDWVDSNLKASGQYEGYYAGFDQNGNLMTSRSTEENSAYFQLNEQLASFFGQTYADRATWAGTFVVAMFNQAGGYFWTGTSSDDMINTASVPLDAQTMPILTLGQSQQYQGAVNYISAITWAENNLTVTDPNNSLMGFTYSTQSGLQQPPRVWLEGVAQGCVLDELLGRLEQASANPWGALVPNCLQTLENASITGTGIIAASSDDLEDMVLNAYYDARLAVAPTGWGVFVRSLLSLR